MSRPHKPRPPAVEQLLALLRKSLDAGHDDSGALTLAEIAELTGLSYDRCRAIIARLKAEGRIECVRVRRVWLDDRIGVVPAYRLKH